MENIVFKNIPCGASIPVQNPHAVSVSLPTMADVIGYEENDPAVISQMVSGYPRFFTNLLVKKLVAYVRFKNQVPENLELLPLTSVHAKNILEKITGIEFKSIEESANVFLIIEKNHPELERCKAFIRHCGLIISSRQAEFSLFQLDQVKNIFEEQKLKPETSEPKIKQILAEAYGAETTAVFLSNSGANAVFSIYETVRKLRLSENRNTIVQLGCLYVDTMEIIRKRSTNSHLQINIYKKQQLENWLAENHQNVSAIVTEIPNNPLVQCFDLPWLSLLCKQYDIVLIVDTTIGTPFNVAVLPYCDAAVESLTKFASGGGDVLMGAIVLNNKSRFAKSIAIEIQDYLVPPYEADLCRLAFQIQDYEKRVRKVSENTRLLIDYLETLSIVSEIYSVINPLAAAEFSKIRKYENAVPGLISIVFDKPLSHYYDRLNIPKGPTLGTEFTLAMPYVYLAHYDLACTEMGREQLCDMGLNPELLRISVGTEPIETIIAAFAELTHL